MRYSFAAPTIVPLHQRVGRIHAAHALVRYKRGYVVTHTVQPFGNLEPARFCPSHAPFSLATHHASRLLFDPAAHPPPLGEHTMQTNNFALRLPHSMLDALRTKPLPTMAWPSTNTSTWPWPKSWPAAAPRSSSYRRVLKAGRQHARWRYWPSLDRMWPRCEAGRGDDYYCSAFAPSAPNLSAFGEACAGLKFRAHVVALAKSGTKFSRDFRSIFFSGPRRYGSPVGASFRKAVATAISSATSPNQRKISQPIWWVSGAGRVGSSE